MLVIRDIKERGRTIESVLHQYNSFSRKVYNDFVYPSMRYADLIIPYGKQNSIAVDFVVENVKTRVKAMGIKIGLNHPLIDTSAENEGALIISSANDKETKELPPKPQNPKTPKPLNIEFKYNNES